MPTLRALKEFRYKIQTSFSTSFIHSNNVAWDPGTASILRAVGYDLSGLELTPVADATIHQNRSEFTPPHTTIRRGTFNTSFYVGRLTSTSDQATNPIQQIMGAILGGSTEPTARQYTDLGSSDADTLNATDIDDEAVGQYVLASTGELRRVVTSTGASNNVDLNMDLSAAPAVSDVHTFANMAYYDSGHIAGSDPTQKYLDWYIIGDDHASDTRGIIGSWAESVSLSGLGTGEVPMFDVTWNCGDWRHPTGNTEAMSGTAPGGGDPPAYFGMGGIFLGDAYAGSVVTRAAPYGVVTAVDLGVSFVEIPDMTDGVNGIGGVIRGRPETPPSITLQIAKDHDMSLSGLAQDFENGTAKELIVQWGNQPGSTFGVGLQKCYLAGTPKDVDLNGIDGVEITLVADVGDDDASTDLSASKLALIWA